MQFSRTNPSFSTNIDNAESDPAPNGQATSISDSGAAAHPVAAREPGAPDAVALDPSTLPTWQRGFILGPNVRFTRTPGTMSDTADRAKRQQSGLEPRAPETRPAGQTVAQPLAGSPVAALHAQLARSVSATKPYAEPVSQAAMPEIRTPLNLPPRTGSPLRVPPRPPRQAAAQAATSYDTVATPASPVASTMPNPAGLTAPKPPIAPQPTTPQETALTHQATAPMTGAEPEMPAEVSADQENTDMRPKPRLALIPDHLLWEMLSTGASERAEQRPANSNYQPRAFATDPNNLPWPGRGPSAAQAQPQPVYRMELPPQPVSTHVEPEAPSAVHLYRQIALRQPAAAAEATERLQPETAPAHINPQAPVEQPVVAAPAPAVVPAPPTTAMAPHVRGSLAQVSFVQTEDYMFPSVELLQQARFGQSGHVTQEALEQSAGLLESVLEDFGVKGEIIDVRTGPVVTLYEFEPAPGVKSSRVINLADDIARSMSAVSARVAVVPGRNVIGIELPNNERETVYLRELIESRTYVGTDYRLPLCLGKTIGGEPVIAELAKMPHLLVAGTTGSGKSVAINTMILSLIYHLRPEECRLIMVDPKMLELSVYDGIPHLLTPVVTDPKKAVLALKWAVREMEDRYRKMSKLGVRNIDGFNERVAEAREKGERIMLSVPVGFDKGTGEQIFEDQELDLTALPYIVVIVDEMADLMMVAGKEIEGAIQRLAQMARAAGIHLIMATQRPSVDVITGTIKANFPTRISFQVTSKIDSRTILGEQGAENLLGQGDMLHMKGGGRIARVHGPFVADSEVEKVVAHLKTQGQPSYLGSVTEDDETEEEEEDSAVFDNTSMGAGSASSEDEGDDLYERAIKIVQRDKKCSTSYIQRRLSIGYNRAASLVERMEKEGLVGPANHVGKREILEPRAQLPQPPMADNDD